MTTIKRERPFGEAARLLADHLDAVFGVARVSETAWLLRVAEVNNLQSLCREVRGAQAAMSGSILHRKIRGFLARMDAGYGNVRDDLTEMELREIFEHCLKGD
jgi:hypothetical protein